MDETPPTHSSRSDTDKEATGIAASITTTTVTTTTTTTVLTDNPCWGSPARCRLVDLLDTISKESSIVYDTPHYLALNKPPDLRMDGPYPATVCKLLSYWYPPPSLLAHQVAAAASAAGSVDVDGRGGGLLPPSSSSALLLDAVSRVHWHNQLRDNFLRPCHQLDYATSGVLLVAKTQEGAAHVGRLLEDRHWGVSKSYLAVVVGNLEDAFRTTELPIWTDDGRSIGASSTMEDAEQALKLHLQRLEGVYRKGRSKVGKKKRRDEASAGSSGSSGIATKKESPEINTTFPGFQPVHSIFNKWKAELAAQTKAEKSSWDDGNDKNGNRDTRCDPPSVRKRRRKRPSQLSDEDWNRIWTPVREIVAMIVAGDSTGERSKSDPTDIDWQSLEWKEVGSQYPALKSAIKEATDLHNNILRQAMSEQQTNSGVDASKEDAFEPRAAEFPTIFALPQNNRTDSKEHKTFYIFCPLAQHPHEFPMVIPSKVAQERGYPPNLPTASMADCNVHGSTLSPSSLPSSFSSDLASPILDFKPALTKCTILEPAILWQNPDGEVDSDGKMKEIPVTKVRLSPITGRRHQLRVHMLLAGHPIVGDMTYSQNEETSNESTPTPTPTTPGGHRPDSCSRMCLHAQSLELPSLVGESREWKVVTQDPFVVQEDGFLDVKCG